MLGMSKLSKKELRKQLDGQTFIVRDGKVEVCWWNEAVQEILEELGIEAEKSIQGLNHLCG